MIEKVNKISNPLTIIAAFAALSEVFGVSVLPLLKEGPQSIYIYFTMIFPLVLLLLFFGTLWWKSKVLYAPTDYRDDKAFLSTLGIRIEMDKTKSRLAAEDIDSCESDFKSDKVPASKGGGLQKNEFGNRLSSIEMRYKYMMAASKWVSMQYPDVAFRPGELTIDNETVGFMSLYDDEKRVIAADILTVSKFNEAGMKMRISRNNILSSYLSKVSGLSINILNVFIVDDSVKEDAGRLRDFELMAHEAAKMTKVKFLKTSELEDLK